MPPMLDVPALVLASGGPQQVLARHRRRQDSRWDPSSDDLRQTRAAEGAEEFLSAVSGEDDTDDDPHRQ